MPEPTPPDASCRWEVTGLDWREGEHRGTLVGPRGLELVPGVSRGVFRRRLEPQASFRRLVASLNPEPWPEGAGARLCVRCDGGPWLSLGVYGADHGLPRSERGPEGDPSGDPPVRPRVAADLLESARPLREVEVRLELESGTLGGTPRLRRLALIAWDPDRTLPAAAPFTGRGGVLDLPALSQRGLEGDLPTRGCSPTALAMLLAFHGRPRPPAEVARAVQDRGAGIYGNWSFNVAFAATLGCEATVERWTLAQLEAELAAGRPAVISERHEEGELPGSPLPRTDGHLLAVVGFTEQGDVVVHDPAADEGAGEPVRRTYPREALARAWARADGVAYRILSDGCS